MHALFTIHELLEHVLLFLELADQFRLGRTSSAVWDVVRPALWRRVDNRYAIWRLLPQGLEMGRDDRKGIYLLKPAPKPDEIEHIAYYTEHIRHLTIENNRFADQLTTSCPRLLIVPIVISQHPSLLASLQSLHLIIHRDTPLGDQCTDVFVPLLHSLPYTDLSVQVDVPRNTSYLQKLLQAVTREAHRLRSFSFQIGDTLEHWNQDAALEAIFLELQFRFLQHITRLTLKLLLQGITFLPILAALPELQYLQLGTVVDHTEFADRPELPYHLPPTAFSQLRSLVITAGAYKDFLDVSYLLERVTSSQIERLELPFKTIPALQSSISTISARWSATLTSLKLVSRIFPVYSIAFPVFEPLTKCTKLRDVCFWECRLNYSDEQFQKLFESWPDIETLTVRDPKKWPRATCAVLNFVSTKCLKLADLTLAVNLDSGMPHPPPDGYFGTSSPVKRYNAGYASCTEPRPTFAFLLRTFPSLRTFECEAHKWDAEDMRGVVNGTSVGLSALAVMTGATQRR
ncbi:hypothetical protein CALVIDRAFT_528149 [Calocera viscosa TUFC12733]|uniref:F-box domain-containing protein n=1 Tax=Calocera viscosa (strain TUFC12733) TaxID=1330018 RepID=A0A167L6P8_CALVF|nr:hypothetical protein CALVIDRAFT_528149 [Calocera viscosa TUFC12733]